MALKAGSVANGGANNVAGGVDSVVNGGVFNKAIGDGSCVGGGEYTIMRTGYTRQSWAVR